MFIEHTEYKHGRTQYKDGTCNTHRIERGAHVLESGAVKHDQEKEIPTRWVEAGGKIATGCWLTVDGLDVDSIAVSVLADISIELTNTR